MTYVVANLHGHLDEYKAMLETIRFSAERDVLYVLGDIVDIGPDPVGLIGDMSLRLNVFPVAGEHDYLAARMLTGYEKMQADMAAGKSPDPTFAAELTAWIKDGGEPTLSGYRALDKDMQEGVIDYLTDMPLYEEVTVGGTEYLLLHAGIYDFTPDVDLDWLEPEDFFSEPLDPTAKYFENKTIIVGHTPTSEANGGADRIFYGNGTIFMDCGLGRGGRLACLRLEDGKEFYV